MVKERTYSDCFNEIVTRSVLQQPCSATEHDCGDCRRHTIFSTEAQLVALLGPPYECLRTMTTAEIKSTANRGGLGHPAA